MKKHWIKKCCMILTCLYLTGCGREEVPYLDTTQTQEQTVETEQKETLKSDQTVQVYVCGEVAAPGVYQLKDGMRICDAVEAAGGLTKAASRGCRAACDHSGNRRDTGGGNSCIPGEKRPVCESRRYHAGIRNQKRTF